jgi:hypothetical protein
MDRKPEFLFATSNEVTEVIQHSNDDDPMWFDLSKDVRVRPFLFDCSNGGWSNLLRVRPGGQLATHYHVGTVQAIVLSGSWRYLEHDWFAKQGTFVYEPPGEIHTLIADPAHGMTTFFVNRGCLIYTDKNGRQTGFDDVFTRLAMFREHLKAKGLDPAIAEGLIR